MLVHPSCRLLPRLLEAAEHGSRHIFLLRRLEATQYGDWHRLLLRRIIDATHRHEKTKYERRAKALIMCLKRHRERHTPTL